ncbi:MAG TPA: hypothetical protein VN420_04060 [Candidatus Fimivivens sp.]|nr:hypothetical protein [Candidatus Fimivivens sp.]
MSESRWRTVLLGRDTTDRPRRRVVIFAFSCFVVLVAGGVYWRLRLQSSGPTESAPVITTTDASGADSSEIPVQPTSTAVSATDAPYQSEHYRAGEIVIGGDLTVSVPESDPSPLSISSVRGESFTASGKSGSKLVITWVTNKPARSRLSYGKGIGQAEAVINETEYGTSHSVIIPDVTPASTYVYVISARDRWGAPASSDPYAVYTGAKAVSLFEIIAGAVGEVFGWAVKK